ncbi:hypothetical protein BGM19_38850 [Streptomyces agglomeratus]|nr:hypothetical protein BGM19_38850 [Streptomyces agglomeratus]
MSLEMERAGGACGEGGVDDRAVALDPMGSGRLCCFLQQFTRFGLSQVACGGEASSCVGSSVELLREAGSVRDDGAFSDFREQWVEQPVGFCGAAACGLARAGEGGGT